MCSNQIEAAEYTAKLIALWKPHLDTNGGISDPEETKSLVNVMKKYCEKLVSIAFYLKILGSTNESIVSKFCNEGGLDLINSW